LLDNGGDDSLTGRYMRQARIFHYAARLPVTLYADGGILYRRPAEQNCVMNILFRLDMMEGLHSSENQLMTPQYLSSEAPADRRTEARATAGDERHFSF
jgi:hypothetical protein